MQSSERSSPAAGLSLSAAERDRLVGAVLRASRALVAVAARSLADVGDEVTLAQYRALVLLAHGSRLSVELAAALDTSASTASRMCDRLVRKGLVRRVRARSDRRGVRISLTPAGWRLLGKVTRRRRAELAAILEQLPGADRQAVVAALERFAEAAGEAPEQAWSLGWSLENIAGIADRGDEESSAAQSEADAPAEESAGESR